MTDTNRNDKTVGRKALGHRPTSKWGRKVANRASRRAAKARGCTAKGDM